jgi:hypothetical protein
LCARHSLRLSRTDPGRRRAPGSGERSPGLRLTFHPAPVFGDQNNTRDEFIELLNLTAEPVPLFDPAAPTNTWRLRSGVRFDFPPDTVLPPNGFANRQEFIAGTDPRDPDSYLRFTAVVGTQNGLQLEFLAVAGRRYHVLYRDALDGGSWQELANLPAQTDTRTLSLEDLTAHAGLSRFYRIVIPPE